MKVQLRAGCCGIFQEISAQNPERTTSMTAIAEKKPCLVNGRANPARWIREVTRAREICTREPFANDEQLRQLAKQALAEKGYWPLTNVRVHVEGGTIQLSGKLPSYFMKQLAQECVRKLPNLRTIRNDTEVVYANG